jgi:hypothetical protein
VRTSRREDSEAVTATHGTAESFTDVTAFDAWLQRNGATECGYIETAPAGTLNGLRGAKFPRPAEQKVLFRLADGRLLYWQLAQHSGSRNPGCAMYVAADDPRVVVMPVVTRPSMP